MSIPKIEYPVTHVPEPGSSATAMDTYAVRDSSNRVIARHLMLHDAISIARSLNDRLSGRVPGDGDTRLCPDFLERIARFYGELDRMRQLCGVADVTPESTIDRLLDEIVLKRGSYVRWCHGHGTPHLWLRPAPTISQDFETPCAEHGERRKGTRRHSDWGRLEDVPILWKALALLDAHYDARPLREKGDSTR